MDDISYDMENGDMEDGSDSESFDVEFIDDDACSMESFEGYKQLWLIILYIKLSVKCRNCCL